jgi:hypothetical protein
MVSPAESPSEPPVVDDPSLLDGCGFVLPSVAVLLDSVVDSLPPEELTEPDSEPEPASEVVVGGPAEGVGPELQASSVAAKPSAGGEIHRKCFIGGLLARVRVLVAAVKSSQGA